MDVYKDFIQRFRRKEFDEVYLLLCDDINEKINEYIILLIEVKFEDGSYHTYYGDVKRIVASFLVYFNHTINEVIKNTDRYTNDASKEDLVCLITKTIQIYQSSQVKFGNDFLPIRNSNEKQVYDEIDREYKEYMIKLHDLKEMIDKIDKKDTVEQFAKENLGKSVIKTSELFNFAHEYIGMMLADSLNRIRTSLEEIHLRMSNNLLKMQQKYGDEISDLLLQLYHKNKASLLVFRSARKSSLEIAEVSRSIHKLKAKIAHFDTDVPMVRLEQEVTYWKKRLDEFNEVANNLLKLKTDQDKVIKEEIIYNSMKCHELPGAKFDCWKNMGDNYAKRKEYLKNLIIKDAKSLLTFFAIRGTDRIFYTDDIGPHYVDEYNHQVYVFDYGAALYHVDCEGDFKHFPEHPYYFDKYGRYTDLHGERIYQVNHCTSQYKLNDDGLLNKITKDCGHSERNNTQCRMQMGDPTVREMLPDFKPIDIKRTLDHETVQYLWDNFGALLPEALFDVGMARPRNPIHYLAHKLIYHKYRRTRSQLREKAKEADLYRANIFKDRKERAKAETLAWRAKQTKRRKPEESDDVQYQAAYDAKIAEQMFIYALNFQEYCN